MFRTSVFLMTMTLIAASASAQRAEVSGTVGWTVGDGVSGNAVVVPGVGTFDRVDPKDSWAWGLRLGLFAGENSEIGFLYDQQPTEIEVSGTSTVKLGDIKLHNYHGYYAFNFGDAEAGVRPYVLFGLGATQYGTVSVTAANAPREIVGETRFSWTTAAGVKVYPSNASGSASRGDGPRPTSSRRPPAGGATRTGAATSWETRSMRTSSSWPAGSLFDSSDAVSDGVHFREKRISNMRTAASFAVICSLAILAMPQPARAQKVDQWTAIQQLQADLKADRQAVVAANLPLTEEEAKAFWPAYKEYRADVEKLGDRMVKLIAAYAADFETMTDAKADTFFNDLLAIDRDRLAVREKYVPKIRAVLPGQKAARFFQIENKLDAIVNVSLASEIPLVPVKR